jgi:pimeloyl-ACP methyl ester carboxylesterase
VPYLERRGASLYYQEVGEGPAILTTHGVTESGLYWILPGVVDRLAQAGYRVVSTDMRAHGRTRVAGEPCGYDVERIAADFGAIADHLGLERFHLLTHATGGMAGLRFAMRHSERLLSLMSTDTGSATMPTDAAAEATDPDLSFERSTGLGELLAAAFRGKSWDEIFSRSRESAREDVFLNRMHTAESPVAAFAMLDAIQGGGDPDTLADFMSAFYDDPDPRIRELRGISCPCLILLGEHDVLFVKPSEQLAREIPNNRHVVLEGRGHMTALEDPHRTAAEILDFLAWARG